jgi:2-keto-4-pentenoate hydratase
MVGQAAAQPLRRHARASGAFYPYRLCEMTEPCLICRVLRSALLIGVFAQAVPAPAQCPDPDPSAAIAAAWRDKQVLRGLPPSMTLQAAACVRECLVEHLQSTQGRVAGYKAALTNEAVQKRFGASAPVRGTLLARMLTMESAFPVSVNFGSRPVIEADLLVEVGDEAINDARTPLEALQGLSRIIPFMELADLVVAEGEPPIAPQSEMRVKVRYVGLPGDPQINVRFK